MRWDLKLLPPKEMDTRHDTSLNALLTRVNSSNFRLNATMRWIPAQKSVCRHN